MTTFEIAVPLGVLAFAIGAALHARWSFHRLMAQNPKSSHGPAE